MALPSSSLRTPLTGPPSTNVPTLQEERVGAWIEHLEQWDKEGMGPAPADPVKELARAGIPHKLRREVNQPLKISTSFVRKCEKLSL